VTPERWQEVSEEMENALRLNTGERLSYLAHLAVSDPELHREVQSLLAAHEEAGPEFLKSPIVQGAPTSSSMMLNRRIGAYRVVEQIGMGGMGEVYRAFRADDHYRKQPSSCSDLPEARFWIVPGCQERTKVPNKMPSAVTPAVCEQFNHNRICLLAGSAISPHRFRSRGQV
jgi:hypothetical protein